MLCCPKLVWWFCTLTVNFASTHCSGGMFFPCRSVFHILKAVLSKEDCYDISMEAKPDLCMDSKFISFIWAERLDSRFLNEVIYVWVFMLEVCSNVLKVIWNAYYATLPVKEVVALILVLDDISSSAVSSGVTVYSPWHFRTFEWCGQCDTGFLGKGLSNSFLQPPEPLHKLASMWDDFSSRRLWNCNSNSFTVFAMLFHFHELIVACGLSWWRWDDILLGIL
jgi:hypothetical protein